jgi:Arc/MetJ-type ribon-helix-helix transcriptional regulator
VCAAVGALFAFGQSSSAYTRILQTAGGALVVLGVYLTSVNLRISRSEQYAGRLTTAIGQLDSQSEAVRLGTIRLLQAMLREAPHVTAEDRERLGRYKRAVIEALDAISSRGVTREAVLARAVSDAVAATLVDATAS